MKIKKNYFTAASYRVSTTKSLLFISDILQYYYVMRRSSSFKAHTLLCIVICLVPSVTLRT